MVAKVDAAVLLVVADVLEKVQNKVMDASRKAEGPVEEVLSKMDDILGEVVEDLRDRIESEDEDDEI